MKQTTKQQFLQQFIQAIDYTAVGPTVWSLGDAHTDYTNIFWPAFLGIRPFALYTQLRHHATAVASGYVEPASVQMLADLFGGRGAVLGRDAAVGRKAQVGMLHQLADDLLIRLRSNGHGRQRSYHFGVLLTLPVLTPTQAGQMSTRWQAHHERFLGALRGFDLVGWRNIADASLVPDMVSATGWAWLGVADSGDRPATAVSGTAAHLSLTRDGYRCRFCDQPGNQVDAIIPLNQGGAATLDNLVTICDDCHLRKNGRTPEQAGLLLMPCV